MGQYQGKRRIPGESTTEVVQCAWVGPAHVRRNGTADVQLGVEDGFIDEEPGVVIIQLTDDQRRALLGRLKESA